uniref:Alpha-galactosidase n=1 Tax=Hucho hucho TaxID=62062 RepID=A0A4W5JCR8_9TELE
MKLLPVIFLLALTSAISALDNGLMRTPPMGWMSWERFRCNIDCENDSKNCISENIFRDMADRLAEDGWKEMGYDHVMIDDCWSSMLRDKVGRLQPDLQRFPGGIAKLARYLHDRGLKLGIYGDLGTHTCEGYPGTTLDKIDTDAQTFASWGVDFLKLDACYPLMSKALNATGRTIGYSCSWPAYRGGLPPSECFIMLPVNYTLLGEICNLWRNYDDIQDSWDKTLQTGSLTTRRCCSLKPALDAGTILTWSVPYLHQSLTYTNVLLSVLSSLFMSNTVVSSELYW